MKTHLILCCGLALAAATSSVSAATCDSALDSKTYPASGCKANFAQGTDDVFRLLGYGNTGLRNSATTAKGLICPVVRFEGDRGGLDLAVLNVTGTTWAATNANFYATSELGTNYLVAPTPTLNVYPSVDNSEFVWRDHDFPEYYTYAIHVSVRADETVRRYEFAECKAFRP
jgi:hypothetical protein